MIACAKWLGREPNTCTRGEGCVCKTEGAKRYKATSTQEISDILTMHQIVCFEDGVQGLVDAEVKEEKDGRAQMTWTVRIEARDGWRALWCARTIN